MTSFATAGAGAKAVTSIIGDRTFFTNAYTNVIPLFGFTRYTYSLSGLKTAVDVTGSGVWTMGAQSTNVSANASGRVKVTIDGVVVLDNTLSYGYTKGLIQVGAIQIIDGTLFSMSLGHAPFNKSLKIEVESDTASFYDYDYYLT